MQHIKIRFLIDFLKTGITDIIWAESKYNNLFN